MSSFIKSRLWKMSLKQRSSPSVRSSSCPCKWLYYGWYVVSLRTKRFTTYATSSLDTCCIACGPISQSRHRMPSNASPLPTSAQQPFSSFSLWLVTYLKYSCFSARYIIQTMASKDLIWSFKTMMNSSKEMEVNRSKKSKLRAETSLSSPLSDHTKPQSSSK